MRNALKFIHVADLHLDSPFKGLVNVSNQIFNQMTNSTFLAFEKIIDTAIINEVDFVLFVGDLFDEEARSLKAQLKVKHGMERLQEHHIDAFISFGNHDHLAGDFFKVEYPSNVHVFTKEDVTHFPYYKDGEHVANIYGFSYEKRTVKEIKVLDFIPTNEDVFHIGMLHGSISTNQDHDVYAPFKLSDLKNSSIDYWALGHIHKREVLSEAPLTVYPGNIQGRHIKESGEKGGYLVEIQVNQHKLTFFPSEQFRFEYCPLDVTFCETIDELEAFLSKNKNIWRQEFGKSVIRLHLKVDMTKIEKLTPEMLKELKELLNEAEELEKNWIWIEKIKITTLTTWDKEELIKGQHFTGELLRVMNSESRLEDSFEEILGHQTMRKFLDEISEEEQQEVLEDAENLLLEELMRE